MLGTSGLGRLAKSVCARITLGLPLTYLLNHAHHNDRAQQTSRPDAFLGFCKNEENGTSTGREENQGYFDDEKLLAELNTEQRERAWCWTILAALNPEEEGLYDEDKHAYSVRADEC